MGGTEFSVDIYTLYVYILREPSFICSSFGIFVCNKKAVARSAGGQKMMPQVFFRNKEVSIPALSSDTAISMSSTSFVKACRDLILHYLL